MKTAIVYYSLTGNVDFAARKIAEKLGADLIPIAPETAYPDSGFRKFLWGGKSAVMGEAPRLTPYAFEAEAYGRIILGTPVWAGTFAPPLRTFLRENGARWGSARFAAFACSSGGSPEKALARLAEALGRPLEAQTGLVDPKDKPSQENQRRIDEFCAALAEQE